MYHLRSLRLPLRREGAGSAFPPPRPTLQAPFAPACLNLPARRTELGPRESPGRSTGRTARPCRGTPPGSTRRHRHQLPPRITRSEAPLWPRGIAHCLGRILSIPICTPFPHIPRKITNTVRRCSKRINSNRCRMTDTTLIVIEACWISILVPPGISAAFRSPRRPLPLGLRGQPKAGPPAIRRRFIPTDIDHRP